MINNLQSYYQHFYKKVLKKRKEFSERELQIINNFNNLIQKEYGESVGEDWLFEYLTFQFNKFYDADTKMSIQLNWIYGKKALENYKNRHDESNYFNQKFRQDFNINRRSVQNKNRETLSKDYKHRERNKFSRISDKILHCVELDLFDEKSADCMFCKNKDYCLKL